MPNGREFDPAQDGWYFRNWGETSPFSWDLYRDAYLGINPTEDPTAAPLDFAFYHIFKNCAQFGNCGGMSLLALALFKYGGYMGFCSPACFYTGLATTDGPVSPQRADLYRAINILQARQFGSRGIENFLDLYNTDNLNNAEVAYSTAEDLLGRGDYPVICLAKNLIGEDAHTLIPYRLDDPHPDYPPGTKIMHLWDPNYPHNQNPGHYGSSDSHLEVRSAFDWDYTTPDYTYDGGGASWCFVVPMSLILPKSRQPMALDMVSEALVTVFVTGVGAAISQLSDVKGRRFYRTAADRHHRLSDIETDPARKMKGICRWPWFGLGEKQAMPGELYFMRGPRGDCSLNLTVTGKGYRVISAAAGNLIQIDAEPSARSKDMIKLSRLATATQSLEIAALREPTRVNIRQLRTGIRASEWRGLEIKEMPISRKPLVMKMVGDLEAVEFSSEEREVKFEMEVQQRAGGRVSSEKLGKHSTGAGRVLRVVPKDWRRLDETKIEHGTL